MILMDREGVRRIEDHFARIGEVLGNAERRSSFAVYGMGLLGSAERKSVESMAAPVSSSTCPRVGPRLRRAVARPGYQARSSSRSSRSSGSQ